MMKLSVQFAQQAFPCGSEQRTRNQSLEVKDNAALVPFLARPKPNISFLGLPNGNACNEGYS